MLSISIDSLSSSSSCNGSSNEQLSFVRVDSGNLAQFRAQNTILFPVQYPDKFYSSILAYDTVKAFLVLKGDDDTLVGSFSLREEPQNRWNEITSGRTVDNFMPFSRIEGDRMYYIMTLGVLAIHRRLGVGGAILTSIIEQAREKGIKCIGLHVHVENSTAIKFYERFGFSILGTVNNYYKRIVPNSAYILELKL